MKRGWIVFAVTAGVGIAAALSWGDAEAQRIDPRRPASFVVGPPSGPAPMHRMDARRSGFTRTRLPAGELDVEWRIATGFTIDQPALAGGGGALTVVSVRGDVLFLDEQGEELSLIKVGAAQVGPAAITSDGTVVYTTSSGDALGIRSNRPTPRFSTRIGGERNVRAAPLPLDDGGVVVATMTDLVVLDAEGNVRSRVTLPEAPGAPLLSSGDKVLVVGASGAVFGWTPGSEVIRLGSFGGPIDGGAVLDESGALLAVVDGNHLAQVDLAHGGRSTRSIAVHGLYLGPPAVRSAGAGRSIATLLMLGPGMGSVVSLDNAGQELFRATVMTYTPPIYPDGGAPPLVAPAHVGPLVDASGAFAFSTVNGQVGVVGPDGVIHSIRDPFCTRGSRSGIVGLTPFGNGAFVVTCDGGVVARIAGQSTAAPRPAPAPPSSTTPSNELRPGPRAPSPSND